MNLLKSNGETKRKALVRAEVLQKAAVLFAEKGFAATNKQDIADAVGIGRTSLYYYFKNKDAILEALVEDVTIYTAKLIKQQRLLHKGDPTNQLSGAVNEMMLRILENPVLFKVLDRNEKELPLPVADTHIKAKKAVVKEISLILEQGIQEGHFRSVDINVAAFTIIGMVTWSAWWYNPEWAPSIASIAGQIADQAVMSIAMPPSMNGERSLVSALSTIREQLDFVERQVL